MEPEQCASLVPYAVRTQTGRVVVCLIPLDRDLSADDRRLCALKMAEEFLMEPCSEAERLFTWNPNKPVVWPKGSV